MTNSQTHRMDKPAVAIRVQNLTKRFGDQVAVDNISFEVAEGEFVTLLGPSGSGKTTTLMMVAGFEAPSSGSIELHGRDVVNVPAKHRDLGIVFQAYSLFPHMNVLENVAFPLRMRNVGRKERLMRAQEMLERVGLDSLAHRHPKQLSGGQQQRVALARALVFEPAALLFDEPLGALDKKLREQLQIEIKSIQKSLGISAIFVTHDQSEAMMLSDRIAVMSNSKIEQIDTPSALYNRPSSTFVATFLGETNLLSGTVLSRDNTEVVAELTEGIRCVATVPDSSALNGNECAISVRPERLTIAQSANGMPNSFEATLVSRTFLGSVHRFIFKKGATEFVVTAPDGSAVPNLSPGDMAYLGWQPHDANLIRP